MDLDVFGACQTRRMYESKPPQREAAFGHPLWFPLWGLAFVHSACLTSSEDITIHQNASRFMPIHPSIQSSSVPSKARPASFHGFFYSAYLSPGPFIWPMALGPPRFLSEVLLTVVLLGKVKIKPPKPRKATSIPAPRRMLRPSRRHGLGAHTALTGEWGD